MKQPEATRLARREMLASLAALGIGGAVFQRALAAQADAAEKVTPEMVKEAEWISGIELSEEDRKSTASHVQRTMSRLARMRDVPVGYDVAPATVLMASASVPRGSTPRGQATWSESHTAAKPKTDEDLAFLPVRELASMIRRREVTSTELTKVYLERLKMHDAKLLCVVTLTEELALKQAQKADREIAAGRYRGPLHGIPWGAKDLMSIPGYKTTWGATPFENQLISHKATVARRLEEAGAVLLAKLSLGALAQGDKWFRGMTRNPWNLDEGSSGSSAGSASATAAGLVGFALGSETLGSIVSPCRRCGTTGLRPTFGRVSRDGCMTLAWTMDKIGPITRSVEDCAIIFDAIRGPDGRDASVQDAPFQWPFRGSLSDLKVGYLSSGGSVETREELTILKRLGVKLVPIELPRRIDAGALTTILDVETATAFDDITREGVTEGLNSWPATFRRGRFVSAVDYIRANRVRTLLMREMEEVFDKVDLYVDPSSRDLVITNLTGHPSLILPFRFGKRCGKEVPLPVTFTGRLFEEDKLLAIGHAFQREIDAHLRRPPLA